MIAPDPTDVPFEERSDPAWDALVIRMMAATPPELSIRVEEYAVYVGGLCPRCGHGFTRTKETGVILDSLTETIACNCKEPYGRKDLQSCGAQFEVPKP